MANLHYSITINAPKETVWHTMLDLETYKQWSSAFMTGSYYIGDWNKGSKIWFISTEDDSKTGMFGKIVENIPYEYISIEQLGEIADGKEDTESESAKLWAGSHENYRFTEQNGVTTVDVDLTSVIVTDEFAEMFDRMWPKALDSLKELCEKSV